MAFKHNPNTASLFPNEGKEKETHADHNGQGVIQCPHCQAETPVWVNGYNKTIPNTAKPFITIQIKPKKEEKVEAESKPYLAPDGYKAKEKVEVNPLKDLPNDEIPW